MLIGDCYSKRHEELVEMLITKRIQINQKRTSFHWASFHGRKEIVELIIAKHKELSDINQQDIHGKSTIDKDYKEII